MSEDAAVDAGVAPAEDDADVEATGGSAAEDESTSGLADADVWRYLRLGAVGLLSVLALVATIQLYTNASAAVSQWVAPTYVPVFQAAFNLVVLLLALAGLAVLARRRFSQV